MSTRPTTWSRATVDAAAAALAPLADPVRAVGMARYLKDRFTFLGIGTPDRRAALKAAWADLPAPPSTAALADAAHALWTYGEREYTYAACDLLTRWSRRAGPELLAAVEPLITTASWWDSVDSLRSAAVGPLIAVHPQLVAAPDRWIGAEDRWLVRSAVIHQLGYGAATDEARLFGYCARRSSDREFFVAKGIGWALRTYARVAPDDVRAFVAAHPELTPLARREALKHLSPA